MDGQSLDEDEDEAVKRQGIYLFLLLTLVCLEPRSQKENIKIRLDTFLLAQMSTLRRISLLVKHLDME